MGLALNSNRLQAVLSDGWQGIIYPLGWLENSSENSSENSGDDPQIQWELPLVLQDDLSAQLATLFAPPRVCYTEKLSPEELAQSLSNLAGVILSCSWSASEADRSYLREAVLQTSWGAESAQVYFLPESIAFLLSTFPPSSNLEGWDNGIRLEGATLVIQGSDRDTELVLTEIAGHPPQSVNFEQCWLTGLNYGKNDLTQDVIRHLLYPLLPPDMTDRFPLENFEESSLGEERASRQRYQAQLSRSPLGGVLLEAAERLQITLQTQPQFTLRIGKQTHILYEQELQIHLLRPYQQQLVRAIEELLHHSKIDAREIKQVLWTGHFGFCDFYIPWLQQQFSQATILKDNGEKSQELPFYDRIALGLATLPFYPSALALPESL